jgi:hypothetical protein
MPLPLVELDTKPWFWKSKETATAGVMHSARNIPKTANRNFMRDLLRFRPAVDLYDRF